VRLIFRSSLLLHWYEARWWGTDAKCDFRFPPVFCQGFDILTHVASLPESEQAHALEVIEAVELRWVQKI